MKQLKKNNQLLEKIIREMSKGYYTDFAEYNPDHTQLDDGNDHSKETEKNDHTESVKQKNKIKSKTKNLSKQP